MYSSQYERKYIGKCGSLDFKSIKENDWKDGNWSKLLPRVFVERIIFSQCELSTGTRYTFCYPIPILLCHTQTILAQSRLGPIYQRFLCLPEVYIIDIDGSARKLWSISGLFTAKGSNIVWPAKLLIHSFHSLFLRFWHSCYIPNKMGSEARCRVHRIW